MTSQAAAILDFQIFQIFFIFELNTENGEKTTFTAIGIYKIVRSTVKLLVFSHFLSENSQCFSGKLNFRSQHTSCMSYYDDVINSDVT